MSYKLYLDDERTPPDPESWVIARSYDEFVAIIEKNGAPSYISFDHDLADEHYQEYFKARTEGRNIDYTNLKEKTGMECAKWLIQKDIVVEKFAVHSANITGAENIRSLLNNWIQFKKYNSKL